MMNISRKEYVLNTLSFKIKKIIFTYRYAILLLNNNYYIGTTFQLYKHIWI